MSGFYGERQPGKTKGPTPRLVKIIPDLAANAGDDKKLERLRRRAMVVEHGWSLLLGWTVRRPYVDKWGKRKVTEQYIKLLGDDKVEQGKVRKTYVE